MNTKSLTAYSLPLWALTLALWSIGCSAGDGDACQQSSDCESGLMCCPLTRAVGERGVCHASCTMSTRDAGTPVDSGSRDTGTPTDTGMSEDTGAATDTGMSEDTGTATDTGMSEDAGTTADTGTDSGTETDSGTDSGAETDSGTDAGGDIDAGEDVDAG